MGCFSREKQQKQQKQYLAGCFGARAQKFQGRSIAHRDTILQRRLHGDLTLSALPCHHDVSPLFWITIEMMSDTEAAMAETAFVISSMGNKAAMTLPTISSWFAVSWGIEYSVA